MEIVDFFDFQFLEIIDFPKDFNKQNIISIFFVLKNSPGGAPGSAASLSFLHPPAWGPCVCLGKIMPLGQPMAPR